MCIRSDHAKIERNGYMNKCSNRFIHKNDIPAKYPNVCNASIINFTPHLLFLCHTIWFTTNRKQSNSVPTTPQITENAIVPFDTGIQTSAINSLSKL